MEVNHWGQAVAVILHNRYRHCSYRASDLRSRGRWFEPRWRQKVSCFSTLITCSMKTAVIVHTAFNRGHSSARSAERSPHQGNTSINRGNSRFFRRAKKEFLIVLPQTRSMRTSGLETLFGHPLIFSYSFVFAWGVPKLLPDRRPQLLDLIFPFEVIFWRPPTFVVLITLQNYLLACF